LHEDLISSAVIDEIGLFELVPGLVMRVPVICTTSRFPCANVGWARTARPTMTLPENLNRMERDNIFSWNIIGFSLKSFF
jgi:hypothetical protein